MFFNDGKKKIESAEAKISKNEKEAESKFSSAEKQIKSAKEEISKSKLLVALGSCAATGGFTVYAKGGQQAQPQHSSFLALQNIVKVDLAVPGCPPSPDIIKKILLAAINNDMDYLKPFMDFASNKEVCGCDLQKKVLNQHMRIQERKLLTIVSE